VVPFGARAHHLLEQPNKHLSLLLSLKKTFSDTISGAKDERPGLAALLDYVRDGDTVSRPD
jgi:DNA invertase Pin-like site-specific DNA recombinase